MENCKSRVERNCSSSRRLYGRTSEPSQLYSPISLDLFPTTHLPLKAFSNGMSSRYRTADCDERKITWDQRDKVIDESANLDFPASAHFTFTTHFRLCRSQSWERTETYEFEFHVSGREGRRNEKSLDLSDLANYRSNFFLGEPYHQSSLATVSAQLFTDSLSRIFTHSGPATPSTR